ncbi:protein kinase [Myxococcota bacterium]|nr:protein kinase [Myxococcota bacterium]MBU1537733.1 protein kinase [Myxococcota bacterium]
MHDDVLYAVFAQRNGYITSQEFTNIFYSYVVDPSKDIMSRLKQKLGKKKFDALKVMVASSMDQKTRMAMENKNFDQDTDQTNKTGGLTTIQVDFDPSAAQMGYESRYTIHPDRTITREEDGRYTIYQEMARGGIGRILVANDEHMGREIAIKELLPNNYGNLDRNLSEEETAMISHQVEAVNSRFLREATVTGRLEHPNIVPVYEIGQRKDDTLYYTMRFVKGRTLADAIYEAKSVKERLALLPHFRDLCNAISYAHSKGVIHRDIKPENIMIGEFGETVVLDWGLAKVKGESEEAVNIYTQQNSQSSKTIDGRAMGTPSYMPPEQARGDISSIDELSDVYSLGAVLYELLTGFPPFEGNTAWETINMVLGYRVTPVAEVEEQAPFELAAITEKALEKEKRDRYHSSLELVQDIDRYMAGERISAYDYSKWDLIRRFAKNNKVPLAAAGLILLALIATLVFISYAYKKELLARDRMQVAIAKEIKERNTANYHIAQTLNEKSYRLERETKLLESRIYAAMALLHNPGNPRSPFYSEEFAKATPSTQELILETESKLYRTHISYAVKLKSIIDVEAQATSLAVSDDGKLAAVGCRDNLARIIDLATGTVTRKIAGHMGVVNSVDLTSDSRFLVTGSADRAVKIWDTRSGRNITTMLEHQDEVSSVQFSADDSRIISASLDHSAIVWEVSSGMNIMKIEPGKSIAYQPNEMKNDSWNLHARIAWYKSLGLHYSNGRVYNKKWKILPELYSNGHRNFIYSATFSPDGRYIGTASWDRRAKTWDSKTGTLVSNLVGHSDHLYDIAFSPDGLRVATSSWDKTIKIWDPRSGELMKTLKGHRGRVLGIHFSPDGNILASVGEDSLLIIWEVASGSPLLTVKAHNDIINDVSFSHDGKFIYTAGRDQKLRSWEIIPTRRIRVFRGHSQTVNGVAFSPNGALIASGSWDKTVKIWDLKAHKLIHNLSMGKKSPFAHEKRVWGVDFSPDGTKLATASMDKTVKVWDVATGKLLMTLVGHSAGIYSVKWSPNGKYIASSSQDKTVKIWSAATGEQLQDLKHHTERVWGIAFSPDNKVIASVGNDNTVRISDVAAGPEINSLRAHGDWVTGVAFSPDGKSLLSCGKRGKIIQWKYPLGIKEREMTGHEAWVNSVTVSHDGKYFATSSDDRTVRIWSMTTGKQLRIIYGNFEIFAMDLSHDGKNLLMGDGAEVLVVPLDMNWKSAAPQKELDLAKKAAGMVMKGFKLQLSGGPQKVSKEKSNGTEKK